MQEALETCEWDALSPSADAAGDEGDGFPFDTSEEQDGLDEAIEEAESDGAGLRRSSLLRQEEEDEGDGGDEAEDEEDLRVEELERMMGALRGVRGTSSAVSVCHGLWGIFILWSCDSWAERTVFGANGRV